jgi:polyhydroxyalkanoate synthesis regulator phasin
MYHEPEVVVMDDSDQSRSTESTGSRSWVDDCSNPLDALKKVALAGLGAVAVATEVTDEVLQELVKKGEIAREDAVREFHEARRRAADAKGDVEGPIRARMEAILAKANLASKDDIDALNEKLNRIASKLDQVPFGSASASPPEPPTVPETPTDAGPL